MARLLASHNPGDAFQRCACFDGRTAELHHDHWLAEQPFRDHQFGIQHRRAGSSANGVVAAGNELQVEHRTLTQTADEHWHAVVARGIRRGCGRSACSR